ncbi:MAG: hypothetical protein V7641_1840 [Blastocatellia bacterium]
MSNRLPSLVLLGVESPVASLELTIEFAARRREERAVKAINDMVHTFIRAGEHGGYSVPQLAPDQSRLTFVSGPKLLAPRLAFELEAHHVDRRAFQVLRNMAARLEMERIEVGRITVRELREGNLRQDMLPEPDDDNEYDVYPEPSSQLSFVVDWVDTSFSKMRRCLVELRRPPKPSDVLDMANLVESWSHILEAGGFAMPLYLPDEIDSFGGPVSQFDEVTIEIVASHFMASETAWFVLVNLLDTYSRSAVRVATVSVE